MQHLEHCPHLLLRCLLLVLGGGLMGLRLLLLLLRLLLLRWPVLWGA